MLARGWAVIYVSALIISSQENHLDLFPFFFSYRRAEGEADAIRGGGQQTQTRIHQGGPTQQAGGADPVQGQRVESGNGPGGGAV